MLKENIIGVLLVMQKILVLILLIFTTLQNMTHGNKCLVWLLEKEFIKTDDNNLFALTKDGKIYIDGIKINNHDYLEQTIKPITRIGVLATGCRVQKWDGIFDKLEKSHDRKTVAIDMEGHAMNRIDAINDLTTIVVKGVGDFATSNKTFDNRFMEYACFALYSFWENFLTDETTKHLFD